MSAEFDELMHNGPPCSKPLRAVKEVLTLAVNGKYKYKKTSLSIVLTAMD